MSHLVDTNIMVEFLRGRLIRPVRPNIQVYSCAIVLGELYFGAQKSTQPARYMKEVNQLIDDIPILECDKDTAIHYSTIRLALEASGGRIPENDMWIAALAIQHNLILVTRDSHFTRIPNLTVEAW